MSNSELFDRLRADQANAIGDLNILPPALPGGLAEPLITDKMCAIIRELQDDLMLVEPTLRFVRAKKAQLASAKLAVLYTPDELADMPTDLP